MAAILDFYDKVMIFHCQEGFYQKDCHRFSMFGVEIKPIGPPVPEIYDFMRYHGGHFERWPFA